MFNPAFSLSGKIRRTERGTASLPQGAASPIFTVNTGTVLVHAIVGEVTTVIQNTANNTKLTHDPAVGTSTDLCAVLNIANDELGSLYGITGVVADALLGYGQTVRGPTIPVFVGPGDIDLDCTGSATGAIKWTLYWEPVEAGAYVVAR